MIDHEFQSVAFEISEAFSEKEKFGLYARAVKKVGVQLACQYFSEAKQESENPPH
jgi:hypothetical protein